MKAIQLKTMLVADDKQERFDLVDRYVDKAKYTVTRATRGSEAFRLLKEGDYAIALLDLHLADEMSGQTVIKDIRRYKPSLPIVAMTNESGDPAIAECLGLGADDFLMAPFSPETFRARIDKAISHGNDRNHNEPKQCGPIKIDAAKHKAWYEGKEFELVGNEIPVLLLLVEADGAVVPSDTLERNAWGSVEKFSSRLYHVISSLTKKLVALGAPKNIIKNHKGSGYAIEY